MVFFVNKHAVINSQRISSVNLWGETMGIEA